MKMFAAIALTATGGALGALARLGVATLCQRVVAFQFPWATFIINISGSFLLGLIASYLYYKTPAHSEAIRLALCTGFLGAYTTFSTFELETNGLLNQGKWLTAGAYVGSSVLMGLIALKIGSALVRS